MHAAALDTGKPIEMGWAGFVLAVGLAGAPDEQLHEMRLAFFAGAQHLFGTIMSAMDAGEEETDDDMRRIEAVDAELQAFITDFKLKNLPAEGSV